MKKTISVEKACKEFNTFVDNVMLQHYDLEWCAVAKIRFRKNLLDEK